MKAMALCVLAFVVMMNAAAKLGFENSARFRPLNYISRVRRDFDEKCEPGSTIMRECNECTCNSNGTRLVCTKMACPDIPEEFKNSDGSWRSPAEIAQIDGERSKRENETACEPGSSRMVKCNKCACVPDGSHEVCTRMICHPAQHGRRIVRTCEPYSSFTNGCNKCICLPNGHDVACTKMLCPPTDFDNKSAIDNEPHIQ